MTPHNVDIIRITLLWCCRMLIISQKDYELKVFEENAMTLSKHILWFKIKVQHHILQFNITIQYYITYCIASVIKTKYYNVRFSKFQLLYLQVLHICKLQHCNTASHLIIQHYNSASHLTIQHCNTQPYLWFKNIT